MRESVAYPWCWRRRPGRDRSAITPPIVLSTYTRTASLAVSTTSQIIQMNLQTLRDLWWIEHDTWNIVGERRDTGGRHGEAGRD
jgi:hypothetical protein